MIRVYFVDDHPLILEGLHSLLCLEKDIELAGQARNGASCLKFLLHHPVDVMLLDITLSDISGADLCATIKRRYPQVKVLGLSYQKEKKHLQDMMENGASGCMLINTNKEELLTAIHTVHAGGIYLSPDAEETLHGPLHNGRVHTPHVTKREKEVLSLIANGNTNLEIAEKLFISADTVDSHRRNLLGKLKARNTAMLIKCAIDNQLLC
ncbi:response regulator [Chitinophaga nivalis]|uniref:Response regulator transcription factor n=1 Tax=Chitinophaga nivalis TaxID=2991709 RepID=A0ABT3IHZ2_9BACT|nr:response regulator transcription factor [Chitinophaga nivalis]MCW3466723.1 response regulator transcription factor [Chitinophaga nivalis]MCW3483586.1 response regulator transcription factor [Chitinophaga nivalis]